MEMDIEKNIMLAKFSGFEVNDKIGGVSFGFDDKGVILLPHPPSKKYTNGVCVDELYFHESWDWLMPVVQKIYQIELDRSSYAHNCRETIECMFIVKGLSIERVYKVVVEFVEHYNKIQKDL